MVNHETEADPWVDDRLATLTEAPGWVPNQRRVLEKLREREQTARPRWWIWALACATSAVFMLPVTRACAQSPTVCAETLWGVIVSRPLLTDFKQVGSTTAPVTLEIYTDYECPPCATFVRDVIPKLEEQYVASGKLRLMFHDLPLPYHRHARLAARYANAAGQLGYYAVARTQIFRTQGEWSKSGDIDAQVALVLSPGTMQKVRSLVEEDKDTDIESDIAAARAQNLKQTPSLVMISKENREVVRGQMTFEVIQKYLESLASQPTPPLP